MKKKILIIEDDKLLIDNLKEILSLEGYEILIENDGESGIKTAVNKIPDLIICDITMPKTDGYEVLSVLSKNEITNKIPFIFLTAKVDREDIRKGMQLGADDYIFKPFRIDDLLNSIEIRLKKKERLSETSIENKLAKEDKIPIKFGDKVLFINVSDIKFIRANTPYVLLKCINQKQTLIRETINNWEKKLPSNLFLRISKSVIINLDQINKMEKLSNNSYLILMKEENEPFTISRRYFYKLKQNIIR